MASKGKGRSVAEYNRKIADERGQFVDLLGRRADEQKQTPKEGRGLQSMVRRDYPYRGVQTGAGISIPGTYGYEVEVVAKRSKPARRKR